MIAERLREHAVRFANDYGYNVADDLNKAAARIESLETAIRTALAECRGLEVYRILVRALAEGQDK